MNRSVCYRIEDGVGLILMNSAPVNALSLKLRTEIQDSLQEALQDEAVEIVVIASQIRFFSAGADIAEFGTDLAYTSPTLPELCNTIDNASKLVVALIHGTALGGGFELALACDYRISSSDAKCGLPEVNLGILPGAGGTQRLPRLTSPAFALDLIVSGKPLSANDLHAAGAIDRVYSGSQEYGLRSAMSHAKELIHDRATTRSSADMSVDSSELSETFFDDYRAKIARRSKGFLAPEYCIQAVEAACTLPFIKGLKKEREFIDICMNSPQSRAQRHLFFAEREAKKIPGIDPGAQPRQIKTVGILGSGTMGGGIAMNFANKGIPTVIIDISDEALERGLGVVRKNYCNSVKKGRMTEAQADDHMALLQGSTDYADVSDCDLIIEAVFEDMDLKKDIFARLDKTCKKGAILASNTSTLDLNAIAETTSRPEDVIGLHFFSPANVMRLLEIVRGDKTADDVLVSALTIADSIGKVPIVSGVCWGFIGNRMLQSYFREVMRMMLEGAGPAQIDSVLCEYGFAMGAPSVSDLAGVDVGYLVRQTNVEAFYGRDPYYCALPDALYNLGRYGQKTGRGFYIYEDRANKTEDPEVTEIAEKIAAEADIIRRQISDIEILERSLFSLINEGAQLLSEGIAYRSGDIDIAYCYGYGFPAFRGGPMQYADEVGLATVLDGIKKYRSDLGDYGQEWYQPAPLLQALISAGQSFKDYRP